MRAAVALGRRPRPSPGRIARLLAAHALDAARVPSVAARRRLLVLALVVAALSAGYLLWFRDSSFVRVEKVTVSGLSGTDAPRERAAIIAAARRMTTLHVDEDALRRALAAGATVEAIRVSTDFPHGLRIEVVEKAPVAVLVDGGERVAVGSGGVLLPGIRPIPRWLPVIQVGALPVHGRLGTGRASRIVAAAAAAPAPLRPRISRLNELRGKGLVAYVRDGPEVILGPPIDLLRKWTAAAAILADPSSHGASYIDVRLWDRPVAGGLGVTLPAPDAQPAAPSVAAAGPARTGASSTAATALPQPTTTTTTTTPSQTTTTAPPSGGTGASSGGTQVTPAATGTATGTGP